MLALVHMSSFPYTLFAPVSMPGGQAGARNYHNVSKHLLPRQEDISPMKTVTYIDYL